MKKVTQYLAPETKIEVISIHKETTKVYSKIMRLTDWQNINKKKGYIYRAYQLGYYQNKNKIEI